MAKNIKEIDTSVKLFDIDFFSGRMGSLLNILISHINNSSQTAYIVTPNPEQIVQATQDSEFYDILKKADVAIPDGVGIVKVAQLKARIKKSSAPLSERITGADLGKALLEKSKESGWNIVLIGGRDLPLPDLQAWPNLFWTPGYKNILSPTKAEEDEVEDLLLRVRPKIVMVAFGAPQQEFWVRYHLGLLRELKVPLVMVVGGAPDFWFKKVKRAPSWIQSVGFEWLFRLLLQPWRWQRQLRLLTFIRLAATEIFS